MIEGKPITAHINTENRVGSIQINLLGIVPNDLTLYISDKSNNITAKTAMWTFKKPTGVTINPPDNLRFKPRVYLLFESSFVYSEFQV